MAGEREWSTSFWDCFSPGGLCLKTFCCPCITYGQTHHRLRKDPNLEGYSCCNGHCVLWCLSAHCGLWCILNAMQRGEMRDRYGLSGNGCLACLQGWCCHCCDLMQQEREAEHLLANKTVMNQPGKVEGMNYGAPAQAYPQQGYQQGYHQQQPMK